jgi:sucrose-6F-phosphate phosphohydrolase
MNHFKLLLCTDMDRTVIPNGAAKENDLARGRFQTLCRHPDVILVYVTGRHKMLVQEAIDEFNLPQPHYAITDVGSQMYQVQDGEWFENAAWQNEIGLSWNGWTQPELASLLTDISGICLQEPSKQNTYKLSYYAAADIAVEQLKQDIRLTLESKGIQANLIWSVDESECNGLLDILPKQASKFHAIKFLQSQLGFASDEILFAGDSGNDLEVLVSSIPAVLVANASEALKQEVQRLARQNNTEQFLFVAEDASEQPGYYSAGILQGIRHFYHEFYTRVI